MRQSVLLLTALLLFSCTPVESDKKIVTIVSKDTNVVDNHPKCPKGNTDSIVPIVYGLPERETFEKADRGELMLGGCIVDSLSPQWYCKTHKLEF